MAGDHERGPVAFFGSSGSSSAQPFRVQYARDAQIVHLARVEREQVTFPTSEPVGARQSDSTRTCPSIESHALRSSFTNSTR